MKQSREVRAARVYAKLLAVISDETRNGFSKRWARAWWWYYEVVKWEWARMDAQAVQGMRGAR